MHKITKLGVLSTGKVLAIVFFFLGIINAFVVFIFGLLGVKGIFNVANLVSYLVFPFVYAIAGFILGIVISYLYNVIAARIGGIEIEIH